MMTSIYLERREPAHNWQTVLCHHRDPDPVRPVGGRPRVETDRAAGHGAGTWFATEGEACEAGEQWRQRKEKRDYRAVNG